MSRLVPLLAMLLCLTACARTVQAPPPAATPLPPGTRVLLVRGDLPPTVQYEILGRIAVRKQSYGSIDWALDRLADEARIAGATAVITVVTSTAFRKFVISYGRVFGHRILCYREQSRDEFSRPFGKEAPYANA